MPPGPSSKPETTNQPDVKQPPLWNVVLLDDDDHSYEYVIRMLGDLFRHALPTAFTMAQHVDEHGRVVVFTTHKEHAELKRDQILAYGKDPLLARCKGSMSATIEVAQGSGDGDTGGGGDAP